MKEEYDWETSIRVFDLFRIIYKNTKMGRLTIAKELSEKIGTDKSVIARQVNTLKTQGIVFEDRKGKYKFLCVNFYKLKSFLGGSEKNIDLGIEVAMNFKNLKGIVLVAPLFKYSKNRSVKGIYNEESREEHRRLFFNNAFKKKTKEIELK